MKRMGTSTSCTSNRRYPHCAPLCAAVMMLPASVSASMTMSPGPSAPRKASRRKRDGKGTASAKRRHLIANDLQLHIRNPGPCPTLRGHGRSQSNESFAKIFAAIEPGDRVRRLVESVENVLAIAEFAGAHPLRQMRYRFLGAAFIVEDEKAFHARALRSEERR